MDPVVVEEYDDAWAAAFEALALPLREAVADLGATVEHIGSTAVPGLAAKPVIDVDVVVRAPADVPAAIARLRTLGYEHEGDKGVPGREAFRWPRGSRRHHVYVVVAGGGAHEQHVRFRDRLRAHPELVAEYASLKRALAERHRDDRAAYTDGKAEFVARVLADSR